MAKTFQTATELLTLDTAVILTTSGVFGGPFPDPTRPVGPSMRVAGLSLLERAVLTLQRAGLSQMAILAGDEEERLRRMLQQDPRVSSVLRWRPVREFPPQDPRTWETLANELSGPCLILGTHVVFARELVERLREEVRNGQAAILVSHPALQGCEGSPPNPTVQLRADRLVALRDRPPGDGTPNMAAEMVVLPAHLLGAVGMSTREPGAGSRQAQGSAVESPDQVLAQDRIRKAPLRILIERAAAEGLVKVIPASPVSPNWYSDVRGAGGTREAERTLLQSLRAGELDGFVDRYFNRKVSAALTRLFLRVGLSPNAITVVATLIGLLAAACFAVGSYGAGVLGALLFQLSAVVDCCDGEVARLTFRESSLGERLDILTDNLVHIAIFAGITWGVFLGHRAGMAEWGGLNALAVPVPWLPLALGGAAILGNGISLWLVDRARSHRGRGIWTDPAQAARTDFILKNVASRDFSVAVLLFAVLDLLPWFLWLAAIGVNVFWIITAWVSRPATTARA